MMALNEGQTNGNNPETLPNDLRAEEQVGEINKPCAKIRSVSLRLKFMLAFPHKQVISHNQSASLL
jgi:hypothetical protein